MVNLLPCVCMCVCVCACVCVFKCVWVRLGVSGYGWVCLGVSGVHDCGLDVSKCDWVSEWPKTPPAWLGVWVTQDISSTCQENTFKASSSCFFSSAACLAAALLAAVTNLALAYLSCFLSTEYTARTIIGNRFLFAFNAQESFGLCRTRKEKWVSSMHSHTYTHTSTNTHTQKVETILIRDLQQKLLKLSQILIQYNLYSRAKWKL